MGVRPENNWPLSGDGIIGCDVENRDAFILEVGARKTSAVDLELRR